MEFKVDFKTRWSDFDANVHMRHTAYNDYASEARMRLFSMFDITMDDFKKEQVGPILLEENTVFKREIKSGDDVVIDTKLMALSKKGDRWKIYHELYNCKGKLCAIITVHGAWLDLTLRKMTPPPEKFKHLFDKLDRTSNFEVI